MLTIPFQAFAASPSVKIVVDGEVLKLDVAPYLEDNRVLVPVRGVFENLGLNVSWKQSTKTATITGGNSTIVMKLGQKEVKVNGKATKIDTAVKLKDQRLFIPVRFVTENSGGNVKWNQATKTVTLTNELDQETKEFLSKVAQVKMDSYSMNMKMKQSMEFFGETMNADMSINMDMVLDPLGLYQEMKMTMEGTDEGDLTSKVYMTKDGYYEYNSITSQWVKYDDEMIKELQNLSEYQMDPNTQLELMARYYKNVKLIEKEDTYELHMSISGEGFQELLEEVLNLTDLGLEEDLFSGLEMSIDKMNMIMVLDKETLYYKSGSMDSDITMVIEGETMKIAQTAEFSYSNINQLEKITIPAEVINTAIPYEEAEGL